MTSFTKDEQRALSALVDMIIPASEEYGVPSAADPVIFTDILSDSARHRERLGAALTALDALAQESHGAAFFNLPAKQQADAADAFRNSHAGDAGLIASITAQCYYRDDRVMESIGMEPRPPHPLGYTVEQGDWSLLDPVRGRNPLYRNTDTARERSHE